MTPRGAPSQKPRILLSEMKVHCEKEEKLVGMIKELAEEVQKIHLNNLFHGRLSPSAIEVDQESLNIFVKCDKDCLVEEEWKPHNDSDPQKSDIFALGCIFYYILTGRDHPFGYEGYRIPLISRNLYLLGNCDNALAKNLIEKMIAYEADKRPNIFEVLKHPLFWSEKTISNYLKLMAKRFESDGNLKNKIDQFNDQVIQHDSTAIIKRTNNDQLKTISQIFTAIERSEDSIFLWHKVFPQLLSTVYFVMEEPKATTDCNTPTQLGKYLTSAKKFGNVVLEGVKNQCPISFGRFGSLPMYILKMSKMSQDSRYLVDTWDKLRGLKHENIYPCWNFCEASDFSYAAIEPFDCTLISHDFHWSPDVTADVICQLAKGLSHLHRKGIVHGSLSPREVVAQVYYGKMEAKITKLVVGDDDWGLPTASKTEDIRRFGCIAYWLLSKGRHPFGDSEDRQSRLKRNEYTVENLAPIAEHLVLTLINPKSDKPVGDSHEIPLISAVLFHPFFWSRWEVISFYELVRDALESNLLDVYPIVMTNAPDSALKKLLQLRQSFPQTNVDAIKLLLSIVEDHQSNQSVLPAELAANFPDVFIDAWNNLYPKLLLRTWIELQRHRDTEELEGFYRSYNFDPQETLSELSSCFNTNSAMTKPTDLKSGDMSTSSDDQFSVSLRVPCHILKDEQDHGACSGETTSQEAKSQLTLVSLPETELEAVEHARLVDTTNLLAEILKSLQRRNELNGKLELTAINIDCKNKKIVVTCERSV